MSIIKVNSSIKNDVSLFFLNNLRKRDSLSLMISNESIRCHWVQRTNIILRSNATTLLLLIKNTLIILVYINTTIKYVKWYLFSSTFFSTANLYPLIRWQWGVSALRFWRLFVIRSKNHFSDVLWARLLMRIIWHKLLLLLVEK